MEEPFRKKKRGQPNSGQLLLPGGKPLRHGAEEKSQGRDSKASDIFPLLKAVGLEAFHGVFCQHELDKAELKHWNPVNLFPSCFSCPLDRCVDCWIWCRRSVQCMKRVTCLTHCACLLLDVRRSLQAKQTARRYGLQNVRSHVLK